MKRQSPANEGAVSKVGIITVTVAVLIFIGIYATGQFLEYQKAQQAQQAKLVEQARLAADPITINGIYNALNAERTKAGASALAVLPSLTTGANQLCEDMRTSNYFGYKNPTTGKDANSFVTDNQGDMIFKTYVASVFTGDAATQTANDAVSAAVKNQATNLNNPNYNSIGWAVCDSPKTVDAAETLGTKYIVGLLAEKADPPAQPTTVYQPVYQAPSRISCNSYESLGGGIHTSCY